MPTIMNSTVNDKKLPCKFYRLGSCNKGSKCQFLHSSSTKKISKVCEYYLQGNCRYGKNCALIHSKKLPQQSSSSAAATTAPSIVKPTVITSSTRDGLIIEKKMVDLNKQDSTGFNEERAAEVDDDGEEEMQLLKNIRKKEQEKQKDLESVFQCLLDIKDDNPQDQAQQHQQVMLPFLLNDLFTTNTDNDLIANSPPKKTTLIQESSSSISNSSSVNSSTATSPFKSWNDIIPDIISPILNKPEPQKSESQNEQKTDKNNTILKEKGPFSYSAAIQKEISSPIMPESKLSPRVQNTLPAGDPTTIKKKTKFEKRVDDPLCPFAMQGNCRFGDKCRYLHGLECMNCHKFCLHPNQTEDQHQEHVTKCVEKSLTSSSNSNNTTFQLANAIKNIVKETREELIENSKHMECVVCFEKVVEKKDPRFGLLSCQHCVCLNCIRTWRAPVSVSLETSKSCPICRAITHFIVPSNIWIQDPHLKAMVVQEYRENLGKIDCKHYDKGEGECPFADSCFYMHRNKDGSLESKEKRYAVGADETFVVSQGVLLSDFLFK